jgi:putative aldouronate transport system permease protein
LNAQSAQTIKRSNPGTSIRRKPSFGRALRQHPQLYLLLLPATLYFLIFHYVPMYGVIIAFQDYRIGEGLFGGRWVGLENFRIFLSKPTFQEVLINTLRISITELLISFPLPIVLALMINEVKHTSFKKIVQTVTYAPHFISVVVVVGMINLFLSPTSGAVNNILAGLGFERIHFLMNPDNFLPTYLVSILWQHTGWNAIIYLAALAGVNPELHEAATIDGATRVQRIQFINIPAILPTCIILLLLNCGHVLNVGFERILLMQNQVNLGVSEVIQTYMYKTGILNGEFSFTAAVGLFNSVVNFILLVLLNLAAKRISRTSLW